EASRRTSLGSGWASRLGADRGRRFPSGLQCLGLHGWSQDERSDNLVVTDQQHSHQAIGRSILPDDPGFPLGETLGLDTRQLCELFEGLTKALADRADFLQWQEPQGMTDGFVADSSGLGAAERLATNVTVFDRHVLGPDHDHIPVLAILKHFADGTRL